MKNKILIPVAEPDFSLRVLPHIQRFFIPADTELILLRIEPEPHLIEIKRPAGENINIYVDQQEDNLRAKFKSDMMPLANSLESAGYDVTVQVKIGEPEARIEGMIAQEKIDLVAMSTHGRSGLDRLLHGSVAEHVLRHSSVPVLLFHPPEEA